MSAQAAAISIGAAHELQHIAKGVTPRLRQVQFGLQFRDLRFDLFTLPQRRRLQFAARVFNLDLCLFRLLVGGIR